MSTGPTRWSGAARGGRAFFFQAEFPYDVDRPPGAAYAVGAGVREHEVVGGGAYSFFRDFDVTAPEAFASPPSPGVRFVNCFTKFLAGLGGIGSVVNGRGAAVSARSM